MLLIISMALPVIWVIGFVTFAWLEFNEGDSK
ncbi:hypothetical protein [Pseudoalteromonas phage C7]|nr:hypothetical protein PP587_gp22 [Pseudoalteromonas phage C7]QAY17976.1 hypothetical protein [Pseudoalteromonas phage C7]